MKIDDSEAKLWKKLGGMLDGNPMSLKIPLVRKQFCSLQIMDVIKSEVGQIFERDKFHSTCIKVCMIYNLYISYMYALLSK